MILYYYASMIINYSMYVFQYNKYAKLIFYKVIFITFKYILVLNKDQSLHN